MQKNKLHKLLQLLLVGIASVVLLAGCVSDGKGKPNRPVDKVKSLELHIKLAQGYIDRGNRESARHHLRKAAEIDRNSADATETMARLYQLEGEPALAEESFKKAIKAKKNFTLARNNYGVFLFGAKRYEEALEQFELADINFQKQDYAAAKQHLDRYQALGQVTSR